jgi:pimeloyl-ACP methyl ester carboxylesterase
MPAAITAARLNIPEPAIADLRERLTRTRFPDQAPRPAWSHGTDLEYLRQLVDYWRSGFDWRAQEACLNAVPQYKTTLSDIDVHFLHVPGRGPAPCPLLLMHGWPGSVFEFLDIIPRLTDPGRFGGDPADAFAVVAPSLPGYGLSFRPGQPRFGIEEIADCLAALMHDRLGYAKFSVQGGDWGAITASRMGYAHPDKLLGLHINLLAVRRERETSAPATPEEERYYGELAAWLRQETGYQWIQGTRPQTLAFALTDSPAGLAAWIVEKFRAWSDCGGDIEAAISRDRAARQHQLLLVHWRDRLVVLSVLRAHAPALADPGRLDDRRADRLRRVPARDPAPAALVGRAHLHRHPPLEHAAAGRPFRGDGAAGSAGP